MNYAKLTNEEIDKLVAERVMGWMLDQFSVTYRTAGDSSIKSWRSDWHPSTDHNDMAAARAEIERRGLQKLFLSCLWRTREVTDWWHIVNATPRQQCEAALWAVQPDKSPPRVGE